MIRLFIALNIQQSIKNYLAELINDFKSKGGKIKWVEPNNIHLTIKFLGNTEASLIEDIKTQLDNLTVDSTPIKSDPKVIWIDLEKNRDMIINLARKIDLSLSGIGFSSDSKPFKPHLTLGRIKNSNELENLTDYLKGYKLEKKDLVFDSLSLIKSTLTNDGPIYKTLHTIKFTDRFSG
jgi:2'-5' RNA ligase